MHWDSRRFEAVLDADTAFARLNRDRPECRGQRNPGLLERLVPRHPAAPVPSDAAGATRAEDWLLRLMECPSGVRGLKPEEELSYWLAAELRRLTRAGRLRAVWSMVPGGARRGGPLAAANQQAERACGYVCGVPDFLICWSRGCGLIELKRPGGEPRISVRNGRLRRTKTASGRLEDSQKDYSVWCASIGVNYAVCRTVVEATDALRRWGVLL